MNSSKRRRVERTDHKRPVATPEHGLVIDEIHFQWTAQNVDLSSHLSSHMASKNQVYHSQSNKNRALEKQSPVSNYKVTWRMRHTLAYVTSCTSAAEETTKLTEGQTNKNLVRSQGYRRRGVTDPKNGLLEWGLYTCNGTFRTKY